MSALGAQAARAKREADATVKVEPEARCWRGFVVRHSGHGTEWARVAIPEHVLRQYMVVIPGKGGMQPPNLRSIVSGMIEVELSSDGFVEGRGWPK